MTRTDRFISRMAVFQYRHPWLVLMLIGALTYPAAESALKLKLRTDWYELLPETKPSVVDLRHIQDRMGASGTLTVFLEGGRLAARERLAEDLAKRVEALPRRLVRWVDKDVRAERDFLRRNKFLYADIAELEQARDRLSERLSEGKADAAFDLGLDEDEAPAATPAGAAKKPAGELEALDALKKKYHEKLGRFERLPDGYYVGEGGRVLVVFIRSAFGSNELHTTEELQEDVRQILSELEVSKYDPGIQVRWAGDLLTARDEHDAMRDDLVVVSLLCVVLILASIYVFYFEVRAILVLGAGVLVGLAWTFGITHARIGYLNSATAFLSSIVAGNGINSGIILIARFLEERRKQVPTEQALKIAVAGTWFATLVATSAASISYGALVLTDFRGFNHFGFIGGVGLLLCWLANYTVVPTLLGLTERLRPAGTPPKERVVNFGRPFLALAHRFPFATVTVAVALAIGGGMAGYSWVTGDPFEYDLLKLRNQKSTTSGAGALQTRINEMLHDRPREGLVVLADRPDQVPLIVRALDKVRVDRTRATGHRPIGPVHTLQSLIPEEQGRKVVLLREIRDLALQILPQLTPEQQKELEPWIPPETMRQITPDQVPESIRRLFREKDGREGLVVHVEPPDDVALWDGRGLLRFADAVRAVDLGNGEVIRGSHRSVVFADMLEAILTDGPKLTLASFAGVLLLVCLTFRNVWQTGLILLALLVGMGWMVGLMTLTTLGLPWLSWVDPIKLNFLNFIAVPITFGIGLDYAVNIVRRYMHEGWQSTDMVLRETGGAVVLCSLTTIWGYLSLLYSDNAALRSFGKLAVLGEITCLSAAMLVLPSTVELYFAHRERRLAREVDAAVLAAGGAGAAVAGSPDEENGEVDEDVADVEEDEDPLRTPDGV